MFPSVGEEVFFFLCDAHLDDLLVKRLLKSDISENCVKKVATRCVLIYIYIKKGLYNGADNI